MAVVTTVTGRTGVTLRYKVVNDLESTQGLDDVSTQAIDAIFSFTNGTTASEADLIAADLSMVLGSGDTTTLKLSDFTMVGTGGGPTAWNGGWGDQKGPTGQDLSGGMAGVMAIFIRNAAASAVNLIVGAAAVNPWIGLLNAAGTITLKPDQQFYSHLKGDPAIPVVGASSDQLLFTAGAGAVTAEVIIIGRSA